MSGVNERWSADLLAEWVAALSYDDLSDTEIAKAEDCILDAIGCAVAGFADPSARAVAAMAAKTYPAGAAPVWFSGTGLNAVGAAYVNAAAASALDIDDGHRLAMGHPGAAVIPAALAVAAETGAGGRELVAAIVAGYEIAVRLGHAEITKPYHTGNWTGFGAAAAACKLKGATPEQIAQALVITAYHCPRLQDLTQSKFMGAHVKESIPWSVVAGLGAADLALNGFTGCRDALDLDGRFDPVVIRAGLGDDFKIAGTYFKRYSVCRWGHTSIEGLVGIMRAHGLGPDDLQAVTVDTFREAAALNNESAPDNIIGAQYSLPYTMAVAALHGEGALAPLTADAIGDAAAEQLAARIHVRHAPEMDAHLPHRAPARVAVETAAGRFEATVIQAWGDAGGDTTRDDLLGKFHLLAGRLLDGERRDAIVQAAKALPVSGPAALFDALAPHAEDPDGDGLRRAG